MLENVSLEVPHAVSRDLTQLEIEMANGQKGKTMNISFNFQNKNKSFTIY